MKFAAGWNLPGCMPEMEPAIFDTEAEAIAFIEDEQGRYGPDEYDGGPYVYWVEPVVE